MEETTPTTSASKTPKSNPFKNPFVLVVIMLAVILLLAVAVNMLRPATKTTSNPGTPNITPAVAVVEITDKGFIPSTISVKAGTVVEWVSKDATTTHIVAANPYPTHKDLPGLVSEQLGNGGKYRYAFAEKGTFKYHDDQKPTLNGTVIVE